jgi:uncharacterized MAPEG superfamily protein
MTIPVWVLLGFAMWTLLTLFCTVGFYRWSQILAGRVPIKDWQADVPQGSDWYRRAMRAHMNCVENLPVYAAIVVAALAARAEGALLDAFAITILVARMCQTTIHIGLIQTNSVAALRFTFFLLQAASMIGMGVLVAQAGLGASLS